MNENYIAPEALDDNIMPSCRHCSKTFSAVEEKIRFYQGDCPHCGLNPSVLQPNPKYDGNAQPAFTGSTFRRSTHGNFRLPSTYEIFGSSYNESGGISPYQSTPSQQQQDPILSAVDQQFLRELAELDNTSTSNVIDQEFERG
jgi:hypothetical protein